MKKILALVLLMMSVAAGAARSVVTVIDGEDHGPVPGAVVVSSRGIIVGLTDSDGKIATGANEFPLSVRSMGYNPVTVATLTDTIVMHPVSFNLGEVVVKPVDRPVMRVITYVREYTSATTTRDTMLTYNEYMLECFLVDGKVKGYKKKDADPYIRNFISYDYENLRDTVRYTFSDTDENSMPTFVLRSLLRTPKDLIAEPEAMTAGALSDTLLSKTGYPEYIWRRSGDMTIVSRDALAGFKNHRWKPWFFKLIGLTTELTEDDWHHAYRTTDSGRYSIYDYIYTTANFKMTLMGKLFKKLGNIKEDMDVSIYLEQYPVNITHYSVEEYKALRNDRDSRLPFQVPESVLPMLPAAEELMKRVMDAEECNRTLENGVLEPDTTDYEQLLNPSLMLNQQR